MVLSCWVCKRQFKQPLSYQRHVYAHGAGIRDPDARRDWMKRCDRVGATSRSVALVALISDSKERRRASLAMARRKYEARKRQERADAKLAADKAVKLKTKLEERGFRPTVPRPPREEGARIELYAADFGSQAAVMDRVRQQGLTTDDLRRFCSMVDHELGQRVEDERSGARSRIESAFDVGRWCTAAVRYTRDILARYIAEKEGRGKRTARWAKYAVRFGRWPRDEGNPFVSSEKARRRHDAVFKHLAIPGQGNCGHHFTLKGLQDILQAVVAKPLRHRRRVLEVGMGLGYVVVELRCMDLPVIAIELEEQAKVIQDAMFDDGDVVILAMDVLDFGLDAFKTSGCTTITCFVGVDYVTDHVIGLFLDSPMAVELAYLVPSDTTVKHEDEVFWNKHDVETRDFCVTFAGSRGASRWVKVVRKTGFYIGRV